MYEIYRSPSLRDYEYWAMVERDTLIPVAKFDKHGWVSIGFGVKASYDPKVFKQVPNENFLKSTS